MADLLAAQLWECCATPPGTASDPADLAALPLSWQPAVVPGTAAAAVRLAGAGDPTLRDYDRDDWWFRCRFPGPAVGAAPEGPWVLSIGGLATVADVWINGAHLLHSDNMFRAYELDIPDLGDVNELHIRCSALAPILAAKRPRPRWKSYLIGNQNLRWMRTTLLGRVRGWAVTPAVVGPWRPVRLLSVELPHVIDRSVTARCDGSDGIVDLRLRVRTANTRSPNALAFATVGGTRQELTASADGDLLTLESTIRVPNVERWWPHTHGDQPLYHASVTIDEHAIDLGHVGFRTLRLDQDGGTFRLFVNDVPIFCRGAGWFPPDPVSMAVSDDELRARLDLARGANLNMLRIPGTTAYESDLFWDLCDQLGLLVWHECMFAFLDPPDDDAFVASVEGELSDNLGRLGGHPALAVICGSQEVEEIAAMMGLPRDRWHFRLTDKIIPSIASRLLPDVPYVSSNPTGGDLPCQMDAGVCQYFGVGGYLRPFSDVRMSNVRFAAECLCLATPPDPHTVDDVFSGATAAGHDPEWKRAIHHDAGRSWDMDDVRDHYTRVLFGVDPFRERYIDAERALDLGRTTNAELMARVFSEWRRPGSTCSGGLVVALGDLRPGAGWGIVDALDRPKAPWFVLRRLFQRVAVLLTDEGLNGLGLHLVNDTCSAFHGRVRLELYALGEVKVDEGERAVEIPPHSGVSTNATMFFDGFRDVSYAFRFTPPSHDVVAATLLDPSGTAVSEMIHLPVGLDRPIEADIGLSASARPSTGVDWLLTVTTRRFAQYVSVDVPDFLPGDSWFHLAPGRTRLISLTPTRASLRPRGCVRALNCRATTSLNLLERP
jgi:beta-mannosidase